MRILRGTKFSERGRRKLRGKKKLEIMWKMGYLKSWNDIIMNNDYIIINMY